MWNARLLQNSVYSLYRLYTTYKVRCLYCIQIVRTVQNTMCTLYTSFLLLPQYIIYGLRAPTKKQSLHYVRIFKIVTPPRLRCVNYVRILRTFESTLYVLCMDCTHPPDHTQYTMNGLYAPSRSHSVHYEGLYAPTSTYCIHYLRIVPTYQITACTLYTDYAQPPEYTLYTMYRLYTP